MQDIVIEEMSDEGKAKLQTVEDMMNAIESAMTEKGFTAERTKEAQVLYTLALYDHSKADGFVRSRRFFLFPRRIRKIVVYFFHRGVYNNIR